MQIMIGYLLFSQFRFAHHRSIWAAPHIYAITHQAGMIETQPSLLLPPAKCLSMFSLANPARILCDVYSI